MAEVLAKPTQHYVGEGREHKLKSLFSHVTSRMLKRIAFDFQEILRAAIYFFRCTNIPAVTSFNCVLFPVNQRLVYKEGLVSRRCGSETLKFGIKQVDEAQISTLKSL